MSKGRSLVRAIGLAFAILGAVGVARPTAAQTRRVGHVPDEVLQRLVHDRAEAEAAPALQALREPVLSARRLARELDASAPGGERRLEASIAEVDRVVRDLESSGASGLSRSLARVRDALAAVRDAPSQADRRRALARARRIFSRVDGRTSDGGSEASGPIEKAYPGQRRPLARPPAADELAVVPGPTLRQDEPVFQNDPSRRAAPPRYLSWLPAPGTRFASIAPTYALLPDVGCEATDADLGLDGASLPPELVITDEIRALAQKLAYSPARIASFVHDNVAFEPYFGSLKGAQGTLVAGSGNATDQASLTIALLRASGLPARYVKGRARFYGGDQRLLDWVGAKTAVAAASILSSGKIFTTLGAGDVVSFTHVWVAACVPYDNYRGQPVDDSGKRWVPLDPSFKRQSASQGLGHSVAMDYAGYMATRSFVLPHEHYEQQVADAIKTEPPRFASNTLADVGYRRSLIPARLDVLPVSLPYEVVDYLAWEGGTSAETAALPPEHRYTFAIDVANATTGDPLGSTSLVVPQSVLGRVTLSFEPGTGSASALSAALTAYRASLNAQYGAGTAAWLDVNGGIQCVWDYLPIVRVEGQGVPLSPATLKPSCFFWVNSWYGGSPPPFSVVLRDMLPRRKLQLEMRLGSTVVNEVEYRNISALEYHALQGYAFQGSDRLLEERAARLLASVRATSDPKTDREATLGEFLHLVGLKYMRYVCDSFKRVGRLDGESGESGNHIGLTSSRSEVSYLFDLPFAVADLGFLVDVPGGLSRSINLETGGSSWDTFLLAGYTASAYESYIWQESARMDAVSSVRGIQFANDEGVEVLTLTPSNVNAEIGKLTTNADSSLNYTTAAADSIRGLVTDGYEVRIPRSRIVYGNWKGQVYVATRQTQSEMSAIFAIGQASGGYTTAPPQPVYEFNPFLGTGYDAVVKPPSPPAGIEARAPDTINSANNLGSTSFTTTAGDPVSMVTGNMYHTERDFALHGRGLPIVFERTYNSLAASNPDAAPAPLGYGWTHSFNVYLDFSDDDRDGATEAGDTDGLTSSLTWVRGDGGRRFVEVAGAAGGVAVGALFESPLGFHFLVERLPDGRYRVREKNGLLYFFESVAGTVGQRARLVRIEDRNGNALRLGHAGGRLEWVKDDLDRGLAFSYDGSNRITAIEDWTARRHEYSYDTAGDLVAHRNPLALAAVEPPVTYAYYSAADGVNLAHAMRQYTLARGNGMTFEYYSNGKVFRHTTTLGERMTFSYNEFRREATTINERGFTRKFSFDKHGNPERIVEENGARWSYAYDPAHPFERVSTKDPLGNVTQYEYDHGGNLLRQTNPSGAGIEYSHFGAFHQPGKIKNLDGNYTLVQYDARGNPTARFQLKRGFGASVDPASYVPAPSELVAWTKLTHDGHGNLLSTTLVRDFVTGEGPRVSHGYDAAGLHRTSITRCGDQDGDGVIEEPTECDSAALVLDELGRLRQGIDRSWYPIELAYDSLDRVIRATDATGRPRDFGYDANGNPTGESLRVDAGGGVERLADARATRYDFSDRVESAVDAGGFVTRYAYDEAGNLIQLTSPDGYSARFDYGPDNRAVASYDAEGHAVTKELDLLGRPRVVTDPTGRSLTYEYYGGEADGRLKRVTDTSSGRFAGYGYDASGRVIRVVDQLGRTTLTGYDELGRPVRVVGPMVEHPTRGNVRPVTAFSYDSLGSRTEVRAGHTEESGTQPAADDLSVQKTAVFDDFGRMLRESDPLAKTWRFAYDRHGNLRKLTDPKGQIVERSYGYGGQLETRTAYRYEGDPSPIVTRYERNALGQVTRAEAPETTYTYGYDAAHRLARVADARAGTHLDYLYSPGGLLDAQVDDQDRWTRYLYDPGGRLAGIWAPSNDLVAFLYDAAGRPREKWFLSGVNTRYEYLPDGSLSQVVNRAPDSSIVSQHDYTYDPAGNRETHVETIAGTTRRYRYHYDALDRLRDVRDDDTDSPIEAYTYDALDNRLTQTNAAGTLAYLYDGANQLREIHAGDAAGPLQASFDYDDNGNLAQKVAGAETLTLGYDALDRLVEAQRTGFPVESYGYDHEGRRIEKRVGSDVTRFVYSGSDIVAEVGDDWAAPRALYTHGPGIDDPLVRTDSAGGASYYHRDGLGSSVAVTDGAGTTAATARYDAWGQVVESTGAIPRYGYTGREPDATGLVYYRARYYDPSIGRFTQRDPAGMVDGPNQYAYAISNPVNFVDPLGTTAMEPNYEFIVSSQQSYYDSGSLRGPPADNTTLGSALKDTARAVWNTAVNIVEGAGNLIGGGALPGFPDYVPFLSGIRAEYDTPLFGTVLELVAPIKGMTLQKADAGLSGPGALRQTAVDVHNLASDPIRKQMSTVALAEVRLAGGAVEVWASGSSGRLSTAQKQMLAERGVTRIVGGRFHGEENIAAVLPGGATVNRWGISWAGQQKSTPCASCAPMVEHLGGKLER